MKTLDGIALACAIAAATAMTNFAHQKIEDAGAAPGVLLAVDIVVVAVGFLALREVLKATLLRWQPLRRAVLGGDHVEGTWVDVVRYPDRDPVVGVVHFRARGSSLSYSGENYHLDGRPAGHFTAKVVDVDMPAVVFTYAAQDDRDASPFLGGLGGIVFEDAAGPPRRYSGYCLDAVQERRHVLAGLRVTDPDLLERLRSPEQRVATALELARPLVP